MDLGWGVDRDAPPPTSAGTSRSTIPLNVTPSRLPDNPNDPQIAQSGIGQFDVRATPLQMAMVAAAIANHGVLMKPYLVQHGARPRPARHRAARQPEQLSTPLSRDTAGALNAMMQAGRQRTAPARPHRSRASSVAGKTGTAETGTRRRRPTPGSSPSRPRRTRWSPSPCW